jgi:DNA-binding NarL/FixJ family response regulator
VLSMHDSKELTAGVKAAGGKGYVVKSHAARDLAKAIQAIIDGGDFFSDPLLARPGKAERQRRKFPLFCLDQGPALA